MSLTLSSVKTTGVLIEDMCHTRNMQYVFFIKLRASEEVRDYTSYFREEEDEKLDSSLKKR